MQCSFVLTIFTRRMCRLLLSALTFSIAYMVSAQNTGNVNTAGESVSREAVALFSDVPTKLTSAEKNQVMKNLGFVLSSDRQRPFAQDTESLDYPFAVRILPTDMNKDGNEEIFVLYGNSFTSGATGASVVLFVKDAKGKYQVNLGFPGLPQVMVALKAGYNDILIGGPGFELPVWRWNGKEYVHYKTVRDSELEKIKVREVEDLSSEYTSTIRK